MAKGIIEDLSDRLAAAEYQNKLLQQQVLLLAAAMGAKVKPAVDLSGKLVGEVNGEERDYLAFGDLGLVSRNKYVYRPDNAPKMKAVTLDKESKASSKELSAEDLEDEEIDDLEE